MDSGQGNGRLNGCLDSDLQRRAGQRAIDKREHTSHRMGSAFFLWGISLDFPWFNLKTSESYINIMYMYRNLQLNHLLSFLFWFLVLKCWACKLGIHQCDPSSLWGSETADWGLGSGWESLCGFYITQALTNWLRESHQSTRYIYWDVTHFFFVAPFVSCIDIYIYVYNLVWWVCGEGCHMWWASSFRWFQVPVPIMFCFSGPASNAPKNALFVNSLMTHF